jgi:transcriptional regulator
MAAKKLPIEDQVLKLLGDGLGDKEVAEKVGTTQNHVWAIRAASRLRPVTEKQLDIAKTIVARKRRQAAR